MGYVEMHNADATFNLIERVRTECRDHPAAVAIEWEKVNGVRVTPNVYTTTEELDKLVMAIKRFQG